MAVTVDGTATNFGISVSAITATLSTSKTNDIILVMAFGRKGSSTTSVSSISDTAGLTWSKRSSATSDDTGSNFHQNLEVWWAFAANKLTADDITVTFAAQVVTGEVLVCGLNGANTSTPWDTNVALPASNVNATTTASVPSVSGISTTSDAGMALVFYGTDGSTTAQSFTIAGASAAGIVRDNVTGDFQIADITFSASLSGVGATGSVAGINGDWIMIADAVIAAHVPVVFNDSFTEIATASDSLANTMTMAATISETATASDTQTNGSVFNDAISESVVAADSLDAALTQNGWTRQPSSSNTWSPATNPSTTWTKASTPGGSWTKH